MSSQSATNRTSRLNCRIDKGLLLWVQMYARQRGITVTSIIVDCFRELRKRELGLNRREVDQI